MYLSIVAGAMAQNSGLLSGKIMDLSTNEALVGATVYIPDLKIGTITDSLGYYRFISLPNTKLLIEVSYSGYQQIAQMVDISKTAQFDFKLKIAITELGGVVITGLSVAAERNRTPTSITVIPPIELKQLVATNIIDAVATRPGISQITTGPGISKPVIRGLGFNRVVVIHDGIRQEGQQWGDEHGIEVDEYGVNRVEILKGAASLAFGSDALAGVINLLSDPTLPDGVVKGHFLINYQTNNGLIGSSSSIGGNQRGRVWSIRLSQKNTHAYKNKYDSYVFNSAFQEKGAEGLIGLNKSWGYAHLTCGLYSLTPGIIEGIRDSVSGKFLKQVALSDTLASESLATRPDYIAYRNFIPFQKIDHFKIVSNNNFYLRTGSLKATLGWQQNLRQEYTNILYPKEYGLYLLLNTLNYDIRYNVPLKEYFDFSGGINGMFQNSTNKGSEFLIPDYHLFDFGIYTLVNKSWNKWTLSGGIRYDTRNINNKNLWLNPNGERVELPEPNSTQKFKAFHTNYGFVSASVGMTFQINKTIYNKLNLSKGFRAPSIAEIAINGIHEGTMQYIIGSTLLKPEKSIQLDYTYGINTEHITLEIDLFYTDIKDYIYLEKMNNAFGSDSITDGYQTFRYTSGNAHLYGGEFSMDLHPHPLDWLHFENSFSYVRSIQVNQPDSMKYLPFTPAPKLQSELRSNFKKLTKHFSSAYFKIGMNYYFSQTHYYKAYDTETATPGYCLIHLGLGFDLTSRNRTRCSVYASITNLTNVAYQSHLSRLKYLGKNYASNRTGVFDPGRNISLKVIVPILFKK